MTSMLPQRSAVATLGYGSGMTAHSLLLQIINPNVFTLTYSLIDSAALIRLEIGKTAAGLKGKICLSLLCHEYRMYR